MSGQISIQVATSSQVMNWSPVPPFLPAAQPPAITVNGLAIQPSTTAPTPTGFQLVVFDITQTIPTPASILVNEWLSVFPAGNDSNLWTYYGSIYEGLVNDLLSYGNPANQLMILASFGLDADMAPDNEAYATMFNYGGGNQLQTWMKSCDPGSQLGNPTSWVSFPANYILVGLAGVGYGGGSEIYQAAQSSQNSIKSSLNVNVSQDRKVRVSEAEAVSA